MLKLGVYCAALHPHSPRREKEVQEDFRSLSKNMGIFPWLNSQVNLHVVKREVKFRGVTSLWRRSASSWAVCFSCASSSSCDSSVSNSNLSLKSHKTRLYREKRVGGKELRRTGCGHGEDANISFSSNIKQHIEMPVRFCKYAWKT